jgi:hypothetical protein
LPANAALISYSDPHFAMALNESRALYMGIRKNIEKLPTPPALPYFSHIKNKIDSMGNQSNRKMLLK